MTERTRPRLYAFPRDIELAWARDAGLDDAARTALERVVDTFAHVAATRRLLPEALVAIREGARHPDDAVRSTAVMRLSVLAHYFPEAGDALHELLGDDAIAVRVTAAATLPNAPERDGVRGLTRALADADWRVRRAAAMAATAGPLPQLLPSLCAHGDDPDARVRIWVAQAIAHQERVRDAI
jgi:HEAT repeat protein